MAKYDSNYYWTVTKYDSNMAKYDWTVTKYDSNKEKI